MFRPKLCILNELVLIYEALHGLPGHVVVVLSVLLPWPRLSEHFQYCDRLINLFQFNSLKNVTPGGVGDTEAEVLPILRHQLLHHGRLARPARPAKHKRLGRGKGRLGSRIEEIFSHRYHLDNNKNMNTLRLINY